MNNLIKQECKLPDQKMYINYFIENNFLLVKLAHFNHWPPESVTSIAHYVILRSWISKGFSAIPLSAELKGKKCHSTSSVTDDALMLLYKLHKQ